MVDFYLPAPHVAELKEFEDKLFDLIKDIKFKGLANSFQTRLRNEKRNIQNESKLLIAADKTANYYKVDKETHEELMQKHITKDYKKTDDKTVGDITKDDGQLLQSWQRET